MISGILTSLLLIALNTSSPAQVEEPQSPVDPEQLLENLDLSYERLAFSETRSSDLLNEPLEVSGELRLLDNRVLERQTQTPFIETQTLAEDYVEVRRPNGHRRRFSLDRAPELAALREVLLAVMSGNTAPLSSAFALSASGEPETWSLELRPRADRIAASLSALVLSGSDQRLDGLEMILTNGDRIQTRFYFDP